MSETVPEGWVRGNFEKLSAVRKTKYQPQTNSVEFAYVGLEHLGSSSRKIKEFGSSADIVSTKTKFWKGDTLFGKLRPYLRKVAYPDCDGVCSTDILALSPTRSTDPVFLFYTCASDKFIANAVESSAGNVMPRASWDDLACLQIQIPPLIEQKKIASILTSVDEVIENTQRQIDKLQELKKATMNELLTKGIGHTEFKDSELGRIPKSWEVKRLDEISVISRGKFSHRPRNDPNFYNGIFPYLQTGDIPVDVTDITSYTQTLNEQGLSVSKLFPSGTLVLTIAATIGEVGVLTFDSCFPDSLVGITCDQDKIGKYFLLYSLRHAKEKLIAEAPESAQKNLNLDILNPFTIKVPSLREQGEIETTLLSLDQNLMGKTQKLAQMQSLKKSLMQDLLTGKVRVQV